MGPMLHQGLNPSHISLHCARQEGFSLIAIIGILAVITIGLSLISPAFVKNVDRRHQDTERLQLRRIADGIQTYLEQNKAFPPSLSSLAPDYVPFSAAQVTTNARGFPRYYAIHPAMVGFSNSLGLTPTKILDARFLLITNLAQNAAPVITTPAEFETWWGMDESLVPNLHIDRSNVGNLFYSLAITPQGNGASFFINTAPATDSGGGLLPTHNSFHLLGTMIGFDEDTTYSDPPEVQFALTTNTAYWFDPTCSTEKQWNPIEADCGVVTLQDGVGSYTGTRDTYLYEFHYNINFGKRDYLMNANNFTPLVRFAIFKSEGGPVPDGATIQSAILSVEKFSYYNTIYHAHRVLKDWVETEATWRNARIGVPWTVEGAKGLGSDILVLEDDQDEAGWYPPEVLSFDVTTGVQAFSDGMANYGWHLVVGTGNGNLKQFHSREFGTVASRPKLVIQY